MTFDNTRFSNRNPMIDLCADGYRTLSCFPDKKYGVLSGTSMACDLFYSFIELITSNCCKGPHVAGVAAIVHEKANKLNRTGIRFFNKLIIIYLFLVYLYSFFNVLCLYFPKKDKKIELYPLVKSASVPIDVSDLIEKIDEGVDNITGAGLCTFYPQIPVHSKSKKRGFELPALNIFDKYGKVPNSLSQRFIKKQ